MMNQVHTTCVLVFVAHVMQRSTTIHTKCPHCKQPILNDCWICSNCHRLTSSCSLWYVLTTLTIIAFYRFNITCRIVVSHVAIVIVRLKDYMHGVKDVDTVDI